MSFRSRLFKEVFLKTNGFALNWPFDRKLHIGDFFTIKDQRIAVLGNIYDPYFQLKVADVFITEKFRYATPALAPYEKGGAEPWQTFEPPHKLWHFRQGCQGDYKSNRFGHEHKNNRDAPDYNAYGIHFKRRGSFFFSAHNVIYNRMPHFGIIYKEVIRRLTAQLYNFNRIFLLTELAATERFSVGVAAEPGASFTLSVEDFPDESLPYFLSSEQSFKVEQSQGMGLLQLKQQASAIAFRAKKLSLTTEAKDRIFNNLYDSADAHIDEYAVNLIDNGMFQLFPKIEINPGNATEFFQWTDMSLDDLETFMAIKGVYEMDQ